MNVETSFVEYQQFHLDRRNKLTHYVGIPIIIFALFVFLLQIPPIQLDGFSLDWALLFFLGVLAFYATLSLRLTLAMAMLTTPVYLLATITPWPVGVAAFVVGWVLQLVGHRFEGKKPAFLTNAVHLLIGPLWIASHLLEKLRLWPPRPSLVPDTASVLTK